MELRALGSTGILVSPLGLGTVKLGRNQQVKYPHPFEIPDDGAVAALLSLARELGINLLDTAPAYGNSEQRLGKLMPGSRDEWVIVSKVGEFFRDGKSHFDFSYDTTIRTVEQSLRNLKTDYLDAVLIHSDGNDYRALKEEGALDALRKLKEKGLIRAHGMSTKTLVGGLLAVVDTDIVMVTCNPAHQEELPVLQAADLRMRGVLIKKALQSGHIEAGDVEAAMKFIFAQPGVSSVIVGTITPDHLRNNVEAVAAGLGFS
ncbi:MAG: aldo/keto reductase [Candidatus Polarisedimenticolaceae bacterium]|nr:aldo/keto reductase [Candidatus Polarisedimenticolaceae bacterium]